ncbi:MAG TPA: hypothetical protein VNA25_19700 [Phycisphaerae bacterium]|nr:hypothetical protein [Phycisphaerae bacterium]
MRMTRFRLSLASLMVACVWVACPASAQGPPKIDEFAAGGMLPRHVEQMKASVGYWVKSIQDANEDITVIKARTGLLAEYANMTARQAGYTYAQQVSAIARPMLVKGLEKDPLRQVKEVNLAIAMAGMPQVTIQPALDAMVSHPTNAAVRYFGWKGYHAARTRLLAQGLPSAQKMFKSVDSAARTETVPQVLGELYRVLELELRPGAVLADTWALAQRRSLQAIQPNWRPWCKRLRDGDEGMCEALQKAARAIRKNADWIAQDKQQKKMALQMLVDLAFHAAKAYIAARAAGETGEALKDLLLECEKALNAVKRADKRFIGKTLTDPRAAAQPQAVLLWVDPSTKENYGVLAWVDFLKGDGVVPPQDFENKPTKAPATKPA